MRTKIIDALQIIAAIVVTGSTAYAMQPTVVPPSDSLSKAQVVQETKAPEVQETKTQEPAPAVETPVAAAPAPEPVVEAPVAPVTPRPTGDKYTWLVAAGIPESDWEFVDYIVTRESGWNPCAYYPGQSDCSASPVNACGLVQQNPCGKIAGAWTDPVAALKWQAQYVKSRYGGYPQAVVYWRANGHY